MGAAGGDTASAVVRAATDLLDRLVCDLPGGGEPREGQREMTALVACALESEGRIAVRAGTGTGKSLAVLAAVAASGRRTVIATATKALQDQYCDKELPFVDRHHDLPWAVLKGRSNYVCLARLEESRRLLSGEAATASQEALFEGPAGAAVTEPGDLGKDQADRVDEVMRWAEHTVVGDLAELPFELDPRTASWVSTGSDGCPGADRCAHGRDCFAEAAIRTARESQVVLVNTALLGADLSLGSALLGDADAYVLDEAHEAEDILAAAFGAELRGEDLLTLERNLRVGVADCDELRSELRRCAAVLERSLGDHLEEAFRGGFPTEGDVATVVARARAAVGEARSLVRRELDRLGPAGGRSELPLEEGAPAEGAPTAGANLGVDRGNAARAQGARAESARRNAEQLGGVLERLTADGSGDAIWIESRGPTIRRVPIEVDGILAEAAWAGRAVVLTSATVSEPMMQRLGLGETAHFTDVGTPFDHREAAMLYVPPLLASHPARDRTPNHPDWFDEAWAEASELIDAAEGRTLFLCTSMRNAGEFAQRARDELDWPVLLQGELPKAKLLAQFAADEHAVAFGTMGLWQGVDVAGSALSCVIIDKIPFPRPDDPLWQARSDAARDRFAGTADDGTGEPGVGDAGYRAFLSVQVPRAAALLAQGAGRLIRRASDRGVVAVLDPRLAEKGYRRRILDELPPMRRSRTRSEVIARLREGLR